MACFFKNVGLNIIFTVKMYISFDVCVCMCACVHARWYNIINFWVGILRISLWRPLVGQWAVTIYTLFQLSLMSHQTDQLLTCCSFADKDIEGTYLLINGQVQALCKQHEPVHVTVQGEDKTTAGFEIVPIPVSETCQHISGHVKCLCMVIPWTCPFFCNLQLGLLKLQDTPQADMDQ